MKTLARIGYEAYATSTGGKTFDGREMPRWDELPERIQRAWTDAVCAAIAANGFDRTEEVRRIERILRALRIVRLRGPSITSVLFQMALARGAEGNGDTYAGALAALDEYPQRTDSIEQGIDRTIDALEQKRAAL